MPLTVSRTRRGMSMYSFVVISPATTTGPVVISVSHATRLMGSFVSAASRTASEIWSAILSGWPSVTDSDVKRNVRSGIRVRLASLEDGDDRLHGAVARPVDDERLQRLQVRLEAAGDGLVRELRERLDRRQRMLDVEVQESVRLVGQPRHLQLVAARAKRADGARAVADDERAVEGSVIDVDRAEG